MGLAAMPSEEHRVESVLEIYLFGGVSQYESFLAMPDYGAAENAGWHLHLNSGELETTLGDCNFSGDLLVEFGADSNGVPVHLGPFVDPIRQRSAAGDLLDRMRICVASHDALPHEVAVPLALSGRPLGHPNLAGLGTHIQRYFQLRDGVTRPVSYVIQPSDEIVAELGAAAYATGAHPASARPLPLVIDQAQQLTTLLQRNTLGPRRADHDALVRANMERYRRRLHFLGADAPIRSEALEAARAAAASVELAPELANLLDPTLLSPVPGSSCTESTEVDTTSMSMRLAAHLLTSPEAGTRYVCVLENGLASSLEAGGFDSHANNCELQAQNVLHALQSLANIINAPGENDPGKIDLDKTLVIINTEFGRTPLLEGTQNGRGHWPGGYPVIMMGGPIRRADSAVYGAIDGNFRALSNARVEPVHHRIAALLALGIWPFEDESYNVSDVIEAPTEADAVSLIRERILAV